MAHDFPSSAASGSSREPPAEADVEPGITAHMW
jgi:hypothetical protein